MNRDFVVVVFNYFARLCANQMRSLRILPSISTMCPFFLYNVWTASLYIKTCNFSENNMKMVLLIMYLSTFNMFTVMSLFMTNLIYLPRWFKISGNNRGDQN